MVTSSAAHQVTGLFGWLLLSFAAAAVGAVGSADAGAFYGHLVRPVWAPPSWLFAPVWTVLYLLMGVSAWLVWRARGFKEARIALVLFVVQLAFNAFWSWVFFVWRQGAFAFAEVIVLWGLIVATLIAFWRLNAVAAGLLLPYLVWVTFASALTFSTWRLNPGLL
ncbi:MAG TPA: TspO/MBR family protein [Steroidobacteraceae bacterium]|jgi:tryptophan-rich sensory protein|nr:TspO/MBR family protein [Steroidobacteraceae bacterium]